MNILITETSVDFFCRVFFTCVLGKKLLSYKALFSFQEQRFINLPFHFQTVFVNSLVLFQLAQNLWYSVLEQIKKK